MEREWRALSDALLLFTVMHMITRALLALLAVPDLFASSAASQAPHASFSGTGTVTPVRDGDTLGVVSRAYGKVERKAYAGAEVVAKVARVGLWVFEEPMAPLGLQAESEPAASLQVN